LAKKVAECKRSPKSEREAFLVLTLPIFFFFFDVALIHKLENKQADVE
jgi:hypothetical protein